MANIFEKIPPKCRYGYARVSSKSQKSKSSLECQKKELIVKGVPEDNIHIEVGSTKGSIENLPIFKKLIEEELKKKDLLIVTKMDRCSQNVLSFFQLQKKLFDRDISFITLDMPYSTDIAVNRQNNLPPLPILIINDEKKDNEKELKLQKH